MIELLSPAGSTKSLVAAVAAGANAVYLGLDKFNARIKADNFSENNISYWTRYCHIRGVKVHVAVNINVKDGELKELKKLIKTCAEAKVDAFIITDMAALKYVKEYAPYAELHASTQLGIHNLYGAKYAERLGFDRVVLSREATLADVKEIKKYTRLEVEYFAHGALCVSFSGGCLFSGIATGNSGNRGLCLQFCRKKYTDTLSGKEGYLLSAKDQCMISRLSEFEKYGVDSIKIEGRLKSAEYVYWVTNAYRKALDGISLTSLEEFNYKAAFNRGNFTEGYNYDKTRDIMYPYFPGNYGVNVGEIVKADRRGKSYALTVKTAYRLQDGQGVKIIDKDNELGGFKCSVISSDSDKCVIGSQKPFPVGSRVHITSLAEEARFTEKKAKADVVVYAVTGKRLRMTAVSGNSYIEAVSDYVVQEGINSVTESDELIKQCERSGESDFAVTAECRISGKPFVPKSVVNNLRREALNSLADAVARNYEKTNLIYREKAEFVPEFANAAKYDIMVEGGIDKLEQASKNICGKAAAYIINQDDFTKIIIKNDLIKNNLYIKLPKLATERNLDMVEKALSELPDNVGIYADNIYCLELALKYNRPVIIGFGLNIYNSLAIKAYNAVNYCLSAELDGREIAKFDGGAVYSYGALPVMTLAHCPVSLNCGNSCADCKYKPFSYKDAYGEYPIRRVKMSNCIFTMHNCKTHNLSGNRFIPYVDLSLVEYDKIKEIVRAFTAGEKLPFLSNHTKGAFARTTD